MACPLCNREQFQPSWLGSTFYLGKEFPYVQCLSCRSLYCKPMPDDETLAIMYGTNYATSFDSDPSGDASFKDPLPVIELLKELGEGRFIDYGCGSGSLLGETAKLRGWESIGIEFDEEVTRKAEGETGVRVLTHKEFEELKQPPADVLHLGDVIEHLTDINKQLPNLLRWVKPGGVLVAQGPLEGSVNLFSLAIRFARSFRQTRTEMAPYHVILATSKGQQFLFQRFGLKAIEYKVWEVAWPAPDKFQASYLQQPRSLGLFTLRRLSQIFTRIFPTQIGNRYFYVGRVGNQSPSDISNP